MFELPIKPGVHAFDHFCAHLDRMLEANTSKEFAELANGAVSYETLTRDMRRLGAAFAEVGLGTGDRVLVASKDEGATVKLFLALLRAGMTPVIGDAEITGPELGELIDPPRFMRTKPCWPLHRSAANCLNRGLSRSATSMMSCQTAAIPAAGPPLRPGLTSRFWY